MQKANGCNRLYLRSQLVLLGVFVNLVTLVSYIHGHKWETTMNRIYNGVLFTTVTLLAFLGGWKFLNINPQIYLTANASPFLTSEQKTANNQIKQRDISTLEKAILGHWKSETFTNPQTQQKQINHLYFSEGEFFALVEIDGNLIPDKPARYQVIKANEKQHKLRIRYTHPYLRSKNNQTIETTFKFSSDRQSVKQIIHSQGKGDIEISKYFYVDDQQSP